MDTAKPKPKPQPVVKRVLVSSTTPADNASTAKPYKLTDSYYEADIYAGGTKISTLAAKGSAAYGENNGLHVALQPDGQLTSWVGEAPQPEPTSRPDESTDPTPVPDASGHQTPDAQNGPLGAA